MTASGKHGKTKIRFSTLPTGLGNRVAIPTFQQLRHAEESVKPKAGFPLSLGSTILALNL